MRRLSLFFSVILLNLTLISPTHAATEAEIAEAIRLLSEGKSGLSESYSDTEVKQMLRDEGYGSVRIVESDQIRFKANGSVFVLYIHEDGDMHLYYGATGYALDFEDMNEWNRTSRLSRAYIDEEGDIALETDLLANAGLNQDMVTETVKVFVQTSVPRFVNFAQEREGQPESAE